MPAYNLQQVLVALLEEIQELEDVAIDIKDKWRLDRATGVNLDHLGKMVACPRKGLSDDDYRVFIRAWIQANGSLGRVEDVLLPLVTELGEDVDLALVEGTLAEFELTITPEITTQQATLALVILRRAKAAGVKAVMTYQLTDTPFGFDGDAGASGFGDGDMVASRS